MCAKRRSRSPRFDTSPWTAVTLLPISFTAAANSGLRRPVMKTYAPSCTNCFAVARPMPLLPPVMRALFPSSFPMYVSLVVLCSLFLASVRASERCGYGIEHRVAHIVLQTPNGRFARRHDHRERRGRCPAEPFDLDLLTVMFCFLSSQGIT